MAEYTDDMEMAIHALKDEIEDVGEYRKALAACKNPELASIFEKAMNAEKEHSSMLLDWINKNASSILR